MRIVIAGGSGFLGAALSRELQRRGDDPVILTRQPARRSNEVRWDGSSVGPWTQALEDADAVVNASGYGLEHWPWLPARRRRFVTSRVNPGRTLSAAIADARNPPRTFIQFSGTNYYGLSGERSADEATAPGTDFLAQLAVQWEAASRPVEAAGVRWVAVRNAVVLGASGGLLPLMALSTRMFLGGRLGSGQQPIPWIHLKDHVAAILFLLDNDAASGPYNLVAPTPTSNADFMKALAAASHRPYWLPVPAPLLRLTLGGLAALVLDGRVCLPARLHDLGFRFSFPTIDEALREIL
jgi:uncharacterized protein (TIGR01777 family)